MTDDTTFSQPGFEVLANETRLRILEALVERLKKEPEDPSLGFSDLRRAAGVRDSGNFNYHLDQLTGRFVRAGDGGYRITASGIKVVAAAIAGVYSAGDPLGPTPIDDDCPVCGGELTASYEDGLVTVACPDDHEFRNPLPPGSVDDRDVEELIELLTLTIHQDMEMASEGICPACNAQLDWSGTPDFDAEFPHFTNQCSRCGVVVDVPVVIPLLSARAVTSFYHDHGIDVRRKPAWAPEFYSGVSVNVRTDPVRIDVSVGVEGEALTGTLDETLTVLDIER